MCDTKIGDNNIFSSFFWIFADKKMLRKISRKEKLISRKYEFYTHSTLDGNPQAMTIHTAPAVVRSRPLKEG